MDFSNSKVKLLVRIKYLHNWISYIRTTHTHTHTIIPFEIHMAFVIIANISKPLNALAVHMNEPKIDDTTIKLWWCEWRSWAAKKEPTNRGIEHWKSSSIKWHTQKALTQVKWFAFTFRNMIEWDVLNVLVVIVCVCWLVGFLSFLYTLDRLNDKHGTA